MVEVMDVPIRATVRCFVRQVEYHGLREGGDKLAELVYIPTVIE